MILPDSRTLPVYWRPSRYRRRRMKRRLWLFLVECRQWKVLQGTAPSTWLLWRPWGVLPLWTEGREDDGWSSCPGRSPRGPSYRWRGTTCGRATPSERLGEAETVGQTRDQSCAEQWRESNTPHICLTFVSPYLVISRLTFSETASRQFPLTTEDCRQNIWEKLNVLKSVHHWGCPWFFEK